MYMYAHTPHEYHWKFAHQKSPLHVLHSTDCLVYILHMPSDIASQSGVKREFNDLHVYSTLAVSFRYRNQTFDENSIAKGRFNYEMLIRIFRDTSTNNNTN